jgi:hypothetical protein
MLSIRRATGTKLITAAFAASAVGIFAVPATGHAQPPMMPTAPACSAYQFIGIFGLKQHDGWRAEFTADGQRPKRARITATSPSGEVLYGNVFYSNIDHRHVEISVSWANDWNSSYTGDVDDAGFVHGTKLDYKKNGDLAPPSKGWDALSPLGSLDASDTPVLQPAP